MESAFAFAPSPFPKHQNNNINPRFPRSVVDLASINGVSSPSSTSRSRSACSCSSSSSLHLGIRSLVPALLYDGKRGMGKGLSVEAASAAGGSVEEEVSKKSKFMESLQLGVLISFWYLLTTLFNIYNKQILKDYPFPLTISALHFGIGTVIVLLMWMFKLHKKPKVNTSQLVAIVPLAVGHTLGNLFTNMSLGKVSVSFTHTIKAMEPFFSVVLSALFLGEMPTFWVVSSLVPVVGGVALASFTEASFDWIGFWSAMASNLTNQSRNVFSKKFMIKKEEEYLDNITLFSIITIMSFVLTVPVALYMEGIKFTPMYLQSAGLDVYDICTRSLMAGVFYHAYQQVAYVILERVSPVTHSVSNCVKRIVIIVASVVFFKTPVSPINSIGTGVAIAGVFLYSRLKQIKPRPKEE